jgi:hypothetical protein
MAVHFLEDNAGMVMIEETHMDNRIQLTFATATRLERGPEIPSDSISRGSAPYVFHSVQEGRGGVPTILPELRLS